MGIFILSQTGHACLPAIRGGMARPEKMDMVLNASFVVVLFIYTGSSAAVVSLPLGGGCWSDSK